MPDQFVSEPIQPVSKTMDTERMAIGEPGLPRAFLWRGETIVIEEVLQCWRELGPCRHGSREKYVRKNWYKIKTATGTTMKIYFDRQPKDGRSCSGWWLFSIQKI